MSLKLVVWSLELGATNYKLQVTSYKLQITNYKLQNMKSLLRSIITKILVYKARLYLKKNRVQVIAITGSIGKTSTKEAIFHLLKKNFKIYASPQGFNTELGISLAILQEEKSGFSSPLAWIKILKRVLSSEPEVYQKIILEMGADHPGDIKKLIKIAPPKIGVVTNVNPVHLGEGQFENLEAIQKEKNSLVRNMAISSMAILNFDDPLVKAMKTSAHKIRYGLSEGVDVRATDAEVLNRNIKFDVSYKGETIPFKVPLLGSFQVYVLLPAIAVGLKLGMGLQECAEVLKDFKLPPSRMNPIPGVNDSTIIDSSYNASPISMTKSLELLSELNATRKIATLGTMNELGDTTKEAHLSLGAQAAIAAKILVAVGQEAVTIKQGAIDAGMPEDNIYTFFDSKEAGHFLQEFLRPDDLMLVKGSQNRVRMERLVKLVMKYPEKANTLLCRQDKAWGKI